MEEPKETQANSQLGYDQLDANGHLPTTDCFSSDKMLRMRENPLQYCLTELQVPDVVYNPKSQVRGESEAMDWWDDNAELLKAAWHQYGPLHPEVYSFGWKYVDPGLRKALVNGDLANVMKEVVPGSHGLQGAYRFKLFTPEFCELLMEEVDHINNSGLPMRRPNGMNRYGNILDDFDFQPLFQALARQICLPMGQAIWPEWVADDDCAETYGFIVRYKIGEDLSLAEHEDTSNVTLNLCLGKEFTGGDLYFKGVRFTPSENQKHQVIVQQVPGEATIHLGGHRHAALPILSGDRQNLILWTWAPGGVVRIAPTDKPKGRSIFTAQPSGFL